MVTPSSGSANGDLARDEFRAHSGAVLPARERTRRLRRQLPRHEARVAGMRSPSRRDGPAPRRRRPLVTLDGWGRGCEARIWLVEDEPDIGAGWPLRRRA